MVFAGMKYIFETNMLPENTAASDAKYTHMY